MKYGEGAAVSLALSIGGVAVAYSLIAALPLVYFLVVPLVALGAYTIVYGVVAGRELGHYGAWGTIMTFIGLLFILPNYAPFLIGLLLILLVSLYFVVKMGGGK